MSKDRTRTKDKNKNKRQKQGQKTEARTKDRKGPKDKRWTKYQNKVKRQNIEPALHNDPCSSFQYRELYPFQLLEPKITNFSWHVDVFVVVQLAC